MISRMKQSVCQRPHASPKSRRRTLAARNAMHAVVAERAVVRGVIAMVRAETATAAPADRPAMAVHAMPTTGLTAR